MSDLKALERLKLLVTIVDRGRGAAAVDLYRSEHLYFDYLCMGLGTANSVILDYFGLSETEKDLVLTLVPVSRVPDIIHKSDQKFHLSHPGRGILFTVPLSGVSGPAPQILCKPEYLKSGDNKKEAKAMSEAVRYDLILVVVNHGNVNTVMDAARAAGARGGTALHARRVGYEDGENLLGFSLQPEKEIVAILTPRAQKQEIMLAVNRAAGKTTRYYCDEFHLLLKGELASWSVEIWKRFRKWGGIPTGITQNIKDLLASREIENIFENSDFIYMLNQASGDRQILAKQLNISPHQLSYVTHSGEGEGLLFYGNVILPFLDRFPKDTELYRIMTTKPQEVSA